jgi:putative addiction module CopG family antidote
MDARDSRPSQPVQLIHRLFNEGVATRFEASCYRVWYDLHARCLMGVTLSPQTEQLIRQRVERGGYASEDDVVRAALESLEQQETSADFAPGELDVMLAEGERSGEPLDAEQVFAELRRLRENYKGRAT